jgi:hypothetical protein
MTTQSLLDDRIARTRVGRNAPGFSRGRVPRERTAQREAPSSVQDDSANHPQRGGAVPCQPLRMPLMSHPANRSKQRTAPPTGSSIRARDALHLDWSSYRDTVARHSEIPADAGRTRPGPLAVMIAPPPWCLRWHPMPSEARGPSSPYPVFRLFGFQRGAASPKVPLN